MMSIMGNTRYSRAQAGATPQFTALCKTLYGDLIDADQVWDDVLKSSPDQADTNAHGGKGRQALRGIGLTGGVLGGALGVRELGRGIKGARGALHLSQKVLPGMEKIKPKLSPQTKRQLGVGGTLAVTDSIEVAALGRDFKDNRPKKRGALQPTHVTKGIFTLPKGVLASAKGLGQHWNKATAGISNAYKTQTPSQTAGRIGGTLRANKAPIIAGTAAGGATAGVTSGLMNRNKQPSVAKSDVTWEGTFSKLDTDQHLAFGWASVVEINGSPVLDKQGDIIEPEEIEKAAYSYVMKSRVGGDMHRRATFGDALHKADGPHKVSDMVESMVFTDDKIAKMGLPDDFPRGWWVGFKVHDEDTWNMVKNGERTGFSIHGKGIRKDADLDSVMGY